MYEPGMNAIQMAENKEKVSNQAQFSNFHVVLADTYIMVLPIAFSRTLAFFTLAWPIRNKEQWDNVENDCKFQNAFSHVDYIRYMVFMTSNISDQRYMK